MKYSDAALKTLVLKETTRMTNARYAKECSTASALNNLLPDDRAALLEKYGYLLNAIEQDCVDGFICSYDEEFPQIPNEIKASEKPCLLFYRGNIDLLRNKSSNIAVIGVLTPSEEIRKREESFVKELVNNKFTIVSGLAKGCDSISHLACISNSGKTIAILPNQIGKIYPKENTRLADEIVASGGLLVTEYYKAPDSKYEATGRFIERDRLQAMFSASIILTASYRKGEGDSGSRYAMEAALKYGVNRYVMFNKTTDYEDPLFGLNKDLITAYNDVKVLSQSTMDEIIHPKATVNMPEPEYEQISLDIE